MTGDAGALRARWSTTALVASDTRWHRLLRRL